MDFSFKISTIYPVWHLSLFPILYHKMLTVSGVASGNETSGQLFFPSHSAKILVVCHFCELTGKTDVVLFFFTL